ncbi:MAG: VanW family protein, partial [Clostridia bacterium]
VVSRAWSMMKCMTSKTKLPVSVTLDDGKIAAIVKDFAVVNSMPVNAAYKVEDDTLILSPAKDGKKLDEAVLAKKIRDKFSSFSYSDITVEPEISKATVLNLDDVYKKVHTDVRDAKISKDGDTYKVTPHVVGTDFDIAAAKAEYAKDPNATHEISLKRTQPKVTTPMLQSTLFQDTLSQQTTYFSPRKVNRTSNVRLAARLMNGTVLNPGEVFSFNNVVGPRTYGRGFREAQIFASGEIVDGLGGGICQVSSTLYMASMKADLKTVSRRNHSFYVDYAPKGQDATVVYGDIDFKFENSTKYPIKIMAYQQDNFVRVTIKGTKTEEKSVKIKTSVISTTPYGTKTQYDSSLSPGERVIKQAGQNGITMEAYRYVYDGNGNLLRKDFENRTKYVPLTEIVLVGSSGAKPAPAKPTPEKKPEPAKPAPPKPAPAKPVPPKPAPVKPKPEKPAPESGQKEDAEKNKPEVPAA